MDSYEPASTKASRIGLTLETYILEGMLGRPEARGYFTSLLSQLALAAKLVTSRVRRAGLADVLGTTGVTNVQGESVQKLDEEANETLMRILTRRGVVAAAASPPSSVPTRNACCRSSGTCATHPTSCFGSRQTRNVQNAVHLVELMEGDVD